METRALVWALVHGARTAQVLPLVQELGEIFNGTFWINSSDSANAPWPYTLHLAHKPSSIPWDVLPPLLRLYYRTNSVPWHCPKRR